MPHRHHDRGGRSAWGLGGAGGGTAYGNTDRDGLAVALGRGDRAVGKGCSPIMLLSGLAGTGERGSVERSNLCCIAPTRLSA